MQSRNMEYPGEIWVVTLSMFFLTAAVSLVGLCLCCRKKDFKSELMGLEGMVKLKNPDDNNMVVSIEDNREDYHHKYLNKNATLPLEFNKHNGSENEAKRATNAPHRSLPDIPITAEAACDNNSELYATVGDKIQEKPQGKSPSTTKKLSNSSQLDLDASSPYARVRSPVHAYDKLKRTEHPYAQVQPGTNGSVAQVVVENDDDEISDEDEKDSNLPDPISHRESSQNLPAQEDIPAGSAIAGRISASQELPYADMAPRAIHVQPAMPQHFSGDSQDSSKGYTSISVREPLANIIAQTKKQNAQRRRREINDSHYATVSDDSDEMYAAIEDPNNQGELYTSGSETYAQIQPQPVTVSVEINALPQPTPAPAAVPQLPAPTSSNRYSTHRLSSNLSGHIHTIEEITVADRANLHSRQASSSSTSSVGNIGSPKPEKRQANSPLPPTPKTGNQARNSTALILEYGEALAAGKVKDTNNNASKMKQSPSKDLEGMYAKVMKKNKLSNLPSENSSPVLSRKSMPPQSIDQVDIASDISKSFASPAKNSSAPIVNDYETIDKKKMRNKFFQDFQTSSGGYETIPANHDGAGVSVTPDYYAQISEKSPRMGEKVKASLFNEPGYESLPDRPASIGDDPKYESLKLTTTIDVSGTANDSDFDPNYEIVIPQTSQAVPVAPLDDGYSQIAPKSQKSPVLNDGYSSIRRLKGDDEDDDDIPGYSSIKEKPVGGPSLPIDSITENSKKSISEPRTTPSTDSNSSDVQLDYENIKHSTDSNRNSIATTAKLTPSESISGAESGEEPNYESVKYLNVKKEENPYEQLHNEKSLSPEPNDSNASSLRSKSSQKSENEVGDYFQV